VAPAFWSIGHTSPYVIRLELARHLRKAKRKRHGITGFKK
jgi:hypothetical protein